MNDEVSIRINLPVDNQGMLGRECPSCKKYFKIKPGTGLKDISTTICPYCEHQAESSDFATEDQIEYAKSEAINQTLGPILKDFQKSLKKIERETKGSIIQIKAVGKEIRFPIKYYSEKQLETHVICDNCGLEFAVYGVFATCPDCQRLNPLSIFKKSIEAVRKRLGICESLPKSEHELMENLIVDSLSAGIAAFDGLGKKLRNRFPETFPGKPKNLFQNIPVLEKTLKENLGISMEGLFSESECYSFRFLFQVRHIWLHNFGEADKEFIEKTQNDMNILGKKIIPTKDQVKKFLDLIYKLGIEIRSQLNK